ncbi:MAG: permease-like cell division protein FtsX [Caldiserica bacterium]|jgi:cell division transport system permease protein|nr:permease-like cell division protein FtsX [Caldisericota bacterium]MDH7562870.1 permease-like cell division protein FtsX [Caldisericota bacterium]
MEKMIRLRRPRFEGISFRLTKKALLEAWLNIRRNGAFSLACIVVSGISLLIFGLFLLLDGSLNNLVNSFEERVGISAYLKSTVTPSEASWLQSRIITWPEVEVVKYVSSEEAMQTLKADLSGFEDVLATLPANPLPASLEIKPKNPSQTLSVVSQLRNLPQVDDVQYDLETVSKLISFANYFRLLGIVVSLLFVFSTWFLFSSSIRMTVYARKTEIEVMKLVGATNNYIRYPFVTEGIFYGLAGGIIACLVLIPMQSVLVASLSRLSFLAHIAPDQQFLLWVMVALLFLGSLLGAMAANTSIRRFLKE